MTPGGWPDTLARMSNSSRKPVGRPRAVQRDDTTEDPREDILRAAADLFVRQGFGGTSTRTIAEAAGMRQATLYYYFSGKDDILRVLLADTVRPSLDMAGPLDPELRPGQDPPALLYRLLVKDTTILRTAGRQVGALYALPEVWSGAYPQFVEEHDRLQAIYTKMCALIAESTRPPFSVAAADLGRMCCQLAENSYTFAGPADTVADTVGCLGLRLNGVTDPDIRRARELAGPVHP